MSSQSRTHLPLHTLVDNLKPMLKTCRTQYDLFLLITSSVYSNALFQIFGAFNTTRSFFTFNWSYDMAKKSWGITFVEIPLQKSDKKKLVEFAKQEGLTLETFAQYCADKGYKQSLRFDGENQCWILAITGTEESVYNPSLCLVTRSDDLVEVFMMSFYKMAHIAADEGWENYQRDASWG